MDGKTAVIAIGGNSLIKDENHQTVQDQYEAAKETCQHIAQMINQGWNVVIGHGNGPQVGFILRRSELAAHELHEVPLDVCGADSQGAIGYAIQQNLRNCLRQIGLSREVVTVVTQVEVDPNDPAFASPSKPIGSYMDEATAMRRRKEGWQVMEDAGRGWRRVVPSPYPKNVVEEAIIRKLIESGTIIIAAGGGGIPVVTNAEGDLHGIAAVIDKDFTASLLANTIQADMLIISTGVERVALNFGKPDEKWLDHLTLNEAQHYLEEGTHFAKGSMRPKIQAVVDFLKRGGKHALITNPENLSHALAGKTGTHITV